MGKFATPDDVKIRLGRTLTAAEEEAATAVIATVTGLITDAVDRTPQWAEDLDPIPEALKALCVEKALAAIVNPHGVASQSETLGVHSRSETFRRSSDVGVFLTEFEERQARNAVYGSSAGSSTPRSIVDRVVEMREGEDVT